MCTKAAENREFCVLLWAVMFIDGSILNIFDCSIIGGYFLALHDADVSYYYSRLIFRKRLFFEKEFQKYFRRWTFFDSRIGSVSRKGSSFLMKAMKRW